MPYAFETNGAAIYRQSFATIRREANLEGFTADEEPVVVRMIHAAGLVGLEAHIRFTSGMAIAARAAVTKSSLKTMCRAASTTPHAWIMRTTISAWSAEKRARSASARMMANECS